MLPKTLVPFLHAKIAHTSEPPALPAFPSQTRSGGRVAERPRISPSYQGPGGGRRGAETACAAWFSLVAPIFRRKNWEHALLERENEGLSMFCGLTAPSRSGSGVAERPRISPSYQGPGGGAGAQRQRALPGFRSWPEFSLVKTGALSTRF